MKSRTSVHLSEHNAARLTAAAARTGATKSALIEAALDRFLESDGEFDDSVTVPGRLTELSRQLERLEREMRTVNETVALHARFHLAVTPSMPATALHAACAVGSERFQEFAAQVGRRAELGTSLIQEAMKQHGATRESPSDDHDEGESHASNFGGDEPNLRASTAVDSGSERPAAVREGGSSGNFPEQPDSPFR